ncbi:hypothetical protein ADIAL_1994 [Alkalibacterium sp. AK22]|uniref:GGDEF domain-containing protein n=1 Tax=Alkalibacterium sp. AK22 TaxID=1229520 RepID=UPI00044EC707|nr:sensor domain-containing diguanylate cyclase [Alkalibacterium sp. AK22]EXJ22408.1 hypothetical protein ADIAL_1994 [Alkalibacterium sp. AK22]
MVSQQKKLALWLVYIVLKPLLFYGVYQYAPQHQSMLSIEYAILLLISMVVVMNPIRTEDSIIFLITGISMVTFIIFGLLAEMILTTYAVIVLMVKAEIKFDEHYRYPLNLLVFFTLSILSASAYYLVRPVFSSDLDNGFCVMSMTVYMVTYVLGNQLLLFYINKYIYNDQDAKLVDEQFTFSIVLSTMIIPFAYIMIFLYDSLGSMGVIMGALPFMTITVGTNIFHKSKTNNKYLEKINQLAQQLNEKKHSGPVVETYLQSIIGIFPIDGLSYFTVEADKKIIRKAVFFKGNNLKETHEAFYPDKESILYRAVEDRELRAFDRSGEWIQYCRLDLTYPAESALVMPVHHKNGVTGVILVSHRTKNMYDKMIVSIMKVLHQYFIIALENAIEYEQLEQNTEKDYLTGLPNLKGFAKKLEQAASCADSEKISLVVLDLDHFKKTNDTYGHQAGNDVLKQIARLLGTFSSEDICISRYGGEEFIILMRGYSKEEAGRFAERIRLTIEQARLTVKNALDNDERVDIFVTASFGVASYPDDCQEVDELIPLADKAMYIGSKQRGRNRVTAAHEGR